MVGRLIAVLTVGTIAFCTGGLSNVPARAQYFSNKDGYASDGTYRVQVELDPYLWLRDAVRLRAVTAPSLRPRVFFCI